MSRLDTTGVVVELAVAGGCDRAHRAYARLLGLRHDAPIVVGNGSIRPTGGRGHRVLFGVDDLNAATRLVDRRGLSDDEPVGVTDDCPISPSGGDLPALDHLVFSAPTRDHAVALFAGVLDLDFRLDQPIGDGVRQLFFRGADLVVEVVTGADPTPYPACSLWGLAWRSADIEATYRRLTGTGVECSEIRVGRKPGTRIFTVRDNDLATRTVVLGHAE